MFRNYRLKNFNLPLVLCVFAITIIGILVIGSANSDYQNKQIIGMLIGVVVMVIVALIDYDFVLQFYWLFYVAVIGLLGAVLVFGSSSKGATRWIDLGVIRFQPSELAKVLLVLFFAYYLPRYVDEINTIKRIAIIAVLAGIPLLLIEEEPDLSTTIVTFLILASMIFYSGLSYKIVVPVIAAGVIGIVVILIVLTHGGASLLEGYQNYRILAWLYPDDYTQYSYQQQNSIMAIGSGQLLGKGLYNESIESVKNGNYISEPQTDFIFAVAGEELGFVGAIIIIGLLFAVTLLCLKTAKKAKDMSGQLICVGIASIIGYQTFVNICVVTGMFPNTGLTLPFMSYGLTSLVTLYFGIGFVLNVSLQAKKY
ncbi:MAG: rod shape-determining protein RodA [Lachnospiraceae bacterium]|nr:rod shape-determining protein RodA [Lachnospiraceae bacterium]